MSLSNHLFDEYNEPAENLCQFYQNMAAFLLYLQLPVIIYAYRQRLAVHKIVILSLVTLYRGTLFWQLDILTIDSDD